MSRIARLAAAKGGKTRAILKLAGRGAILLTVGTFNLAMWMFWAVLTIYGFVASLKRMSERCTERYCARRRLRRARRGERRAREELERCVREQQERELQRRELRVVVPAAPLDEPTVIYSNAPGVVPAMVPKLDLTYRPAIGLPPCPGLAAPRRQGGKLGAAPIESTVLSFRGLPKARVRNS
jgi:hypothetical protein